MSYNMKPTAEQMQSFSPWQECYDENSGYSYYWNLTTNEVTWEIPPEYQIALQKWQLLQQHQIAAVKKTADSSLQLTSASVSDKLEAKKCDSSSTKNSVASKGKNPYNSDSEEDEKIELITSYGSYSSDDSDESESSLKLKSKVSKKVKTEPIKDKSNTAAFKSRKIDSSGSNSNIYGPSFPPVSTKLDASVSSSEEKKSGSISLVPYGMDNSDNSIADKSIPSESSCSFSAENFPKDPGRCSDDKKVGSPNIHDNKSNASMNQTKQKKSESTDNSDEEGDDDEDSDDCEEDESLILSKLKSQALVLKQLGGEIPDEIKCLIDGDDSNIGIDDIIALIENETPPDHSKKSGKANDKKSTSEEPARQSVKSNSDSSADSQDQSIKAAVELIEQSCKEEPVKDNKPSSFALIAGYGDDSDQEDSISPSKSTAAVASKRKASFPMPVADERSKESAFSTKNHIASKPAFKKLKLSARAKALINASIITAKARATSTINDSEEISAKSGTVTSLPQSRAPEEKVVEVPPPQGPGLPTLDTKETLKVETNCVPHLLKTVEGIKKEIKTETVRPVNGALVIGQEIPKTELPSSSSFSAKLNVLPESDNQQSCGYTTIWNNAATLASDEKRGLGFSGGAQSSSSSSSSSSHSKKTDKKESGIQFVKAETINVSPSAPVIIPPLATIKEEDVDKSQIISLSELIVEKVKYLSEGKEPVSPVQIMTIQIETLVSAWEADCLTGKYLLDWLNATSKQLSTLEDAAAPKGWKCEWDRLSEKYFTTCCKWTHELICVQDLLEIRKPVAYNGTIRLQKTMEKHAKKLRWICVSHRHLPPPKFLLRHHRRPLLFPKSPPPPKTPPPPPPPVISLSPPPPPVISNNNFSSISSLTSKKSSAINFSSVIPDKRKASKPHSDILDGNIPLPSSTPPLPKDPPPPIHSTPPLPPLPPPISHSRIALPLPPGVDRADESISNGYLGKKKIETKVLSVNKVPFFSAQRTPPPPPPSHPPPQPPLPPNSPLCRTARVPPQHAPFPSAPSSTSRIISNQKIESNTSYQVVGAPSYSSIPTHSVQTVQTSRPQVPPTDLNSALDSFYSDIASLEATVPDQSAVSSSTVVEPSVSSPVQSVQPPVPTEHETVSSTRKKRKVKLAAGLTLKKRGLDSLVAKWEKVNKTVCD